MTRELGVYEGNKADLEANRVIEAAVAQSYADQNGLFFLETSAKTATNVDGMFNQYLSSFSDACMAPSFIARTSPEDNDLPLDQ